MNFKEAFQRLGIEVTKDEKAIKNAYREKLAVTNPEDNPEGFKLLRGAYEEAVRYAKSDFGLSVWRKFMHAFVPVRMWSCGRIFLMTIFLCLWRKRKIAEINCCVFLWSILNSPHRYGSCLIKNWES